MPSKIGAKVRDLRKERGLSLDALARLATMSKSYLWELENRDDVNPTTDKVASIAAAFDLPVAYFIDDSIDEPQEAHKDRAFFRNYAKLEPDQKVHMEAILKSFLARPRSPK